MEEYLRKLEGLLQPLTQAGGTACREQGILRSCAPQDPDTSGGISSGTNVAHNPCVPQADGVGYRYLKLFL